MNKSLQLHIPTPCHEDWSKMTVNEQGRFCLSCQKSVVDFTKMSDQEIIQFFKVKQGNTCGRFRDDQLNRGYANQKPKGLKWYKYYLHVLIPTLLLASKSYSQGGVILKKQPTCEIPKKQAVEKSMWVGDIAIIRNETAIHGKITDQNGTPIEAATIIIKGTRFGCVADENGNFELTSDRSLPLTLVISRVGFKSREVRVNGKSSADSINVILNEDAETLKGEVVVVAYPAIACRRVTMGSTSMVNEDSLKQKNNLFHRFGKMIVDSFRTGKSSIYPNPIRLSSILNVEHPCSVAGNYSVRIADIGGRILQIENFDVSSKFLQKQIRLNHHFIAGSYIVQLFDPKGKKLMSQKLVVH